MWKDLKQNKVTSYLLSIQDMSLYCCINFLTRKEHFYDSHNEEGLEIEFKVHCTEGED